MAPPEVVTSSMTSLTYSMQKEPSLLVEPFPVHGLAEIPGFPSQKGFVHFTHGNEMFRQSQQGLTAPVEVNTYMERAK